MNQPTIYFVDVDGDLMKPLEGPLRSLGCAGRAFSSAPAFLKVYTPDMTGCVIVDQQRPGPTGLNLLKRLRFGRSRCAAGDPDGRLRGCSHGRRRHEIGGLRLPEETL